MKLVLLPGLDGTGDLFLEFRRALRWPGEVITWRCPGQSRYLRAPRHLSPGEAAEHFLSRIPGGPFVLVAESYSGRLALDLAARGVDGLCGVVLCASFARSPLGSVGTPLSHLPWRWLFRRRPPKWALRRWMLGPDCDAEAIGQLRSILGAVSPEILARRSREVLTWQHRAPLPSPKLPLLYLQPTRDRLVGRRGLRGLQEDGLRLETVEIAGPHLLLQANPVDSAAAVRAFVERIVGDRADLSMPTGALHRKRLRGALKNWARPFLDGAVFYCGYCSTWKTVREITRAVRELGPGGELLVRMPEASTVPADVLSPDVVAMLGEWAGWLPDCLLRAGINSEVLADVAVRFENGPHGVRAYLEWVDDRGRSYRTSVY